MQDVSTGYGGGRGVEDWRFGRIGCAFLHRAEPLRGGPASVGRGHPTRKQRRMASEPLAKINVGIAVAVDKIAERRWQGETCMITPDAPCSNSN